MRPIDADNLYKEIETVKVKAEEAIKNANSTLTRMIAVTQLAERDNFAGLVCWMKTLDVAEVVRCKDCKHRHNPSRCALYYGYCDGKEHFIDRGDLFYCAFGEKK